MKNKLRLVSNIDGIHCLGCLNRINTKLQSIGASKVDVDISEKIIKIDFLGEENDADKFLNTINELGYKTKKIVIFDPDVLNNL